MKSIKFLLGIVILLAIVTVFMLLNKDDSSVKSGNKDFALHDQDEISRIEIIINTIVVSLEKNQNNWTMNEFTKILLRHTCIIFLQLSTDR